MMSYLESITRPDKSFDVHQCDRFTHNTKESHKTDVKRICQYLQSNKYNGLVFNTPNILVVNWYNDTDFVGLWGYGKPQDPISDRIRTEFVVTFSNFPLLYVSKIQTHIYLSTLHYEYVALYNYVRSLLTLKIIIK